MKNKNKKISKCGHSVRSYNLGKMSNLVMGIFLMILSKEVIDYFFENYYIVSL